MLLSPRNLNFRFSRATALSPARLSTFRSAAGSGRVNGVPRPHRCRCQTMIFYTMSPVERIDHVRGSLQLRAETPQRVIRSTPSNLRKFHQLLNNFVVSSDRSFVSTSLQHLPGVLPESRNELLLRVLPFIIFLINVFPFFFFFFNRIF